MKNFTKVLLALSLGFFSLTNIEAKHHYKKLQILIDPLASWFKFALNTGTALSANPLIPRPFGSNYTANGLIYPGGTIDVHNQTSFSVDKDGNPLTPSNSIGTFWEFTNVMTTYSLLPTPQPAGTEMNHSKYVFDFDPNTTDPDDKNMVCSEGIIASLGLIANNQKALEGVFAVQGGTEDNKNAHGQFKAKWYVAGLPSAPAVVINIKFTDEIEVE